jgi:hypothetical protein
MFDQGLLSKIQNSVVTSLSLESVLKLAVGLSVPPHRIFSLLDRMDMHELVMKSYAGEFSELLAEKLAGEEPEVICRLREKLKSAADKPLRVEAIGRARGHRFASEVEGDGVLGRSGALER